MRNPKVVSTHRLLKNLGKLVEKKDGEEK